ncbi:MAG: SMAD/FHA domain-containing protein [Benjaminiella poitrasii]|nr:MAG: SMAD/FHA domain-containing protein [Benjaminiella poitrasii]
MSNDQDFNTELDDYINSTSHNSTVEDEKEEEDWTYDEHQGVYVMHSKRLVMYYADEGWICGDYKALYESNLYLYDSDTQSWFNTDTKEHVYYDETSQSYVPLTEEYWAGHPQSTRSIRIVVQSSPHFQSGQVAIIDENGITIGRDRSSWETNRLRLPEMVVSKYHALLYFDKKDKTFYLVDNGSQHGTFVNDQRLSEVKQSSLPHPLHHLDRIQIGSTCLEVHDHSNDWPCQDCMTNSPIDISSIGTKKTVAQTPKYDNMTPEELELRRREWNKNAKQSYASETSVQPETQEYRDRADMRRRTTLPEKFIKQKEQNYTLHKNPSPSPASFHTPVRGIGNKILQKLGWQEGQSLGKNQNGLLVPLTPTKQLDRSGLGSQQRFIPNESRKEKQWRLTQERYQRASE